MSRLRNLLALLVGSVVVAGCISDPPPETSETEQPEARESVVTGPPRPSSSIAATLPPVGDWGPLAVVNDSNASGADSARWDGTLRIGEECVTVSGSTMVWGSNHVRWDAERRVILLHDFITRELVELADGDEVEFGGGDVGREPPWIARPDPSCPAGAFGVSTVGSVNGIEP
jgi:hypothetical protein